MQRSRTNERKIVRDLELRLGPSFPPKEDMLAGNCGRSYPNLITIDDDEEEDEDDVLMYSLCPASSTGAMGLYPFSTSWAPVIPEEDLELRLGSRATECNHVGREEPQQTWNFVKAKSGLASSSRHQVMEVGAVRLRCTICMDTMKEETSTVCGHVFCKSCITSAIRIQNRCPTCRKELNMGSIHRIYLPGTTS